MIKFTSNVNLIYQSRKLCIHQNSNPKLLKYCYYIYLFVQTILIDVKFQIEIWSKATVFICTLNKNIFMVCSMAKQWLETRKHWTVVPFQYVTPQLCISTSPWVIKPITFDLAVCGLLRDIIFEVLVKNRDYRSSVMFDVRQSSTLANERYSRNIADLLKLDIYTIG